MFLNLIEFNQPFNSTKFTTNIFEIVHQIYQTSKLQNSQLHLSSTKQHLRSIQILTQKLCEEF
ncbi:hypothetical protein BBW65_07195 [Helicobacter enhydrae]|uniref:Uncharacterized protein n=1 Tax=Helicobacter enhydrae TaxID=222136 RepID=A0A1B1U7C8_9HELI|nr:hypothetical protein BBW65_07195 [Helicobacter enhydrae]